MRLLIVNVTRQGGHKPQLEVCAIFEDMLTKSKSWQQQSPLGGPELAKLMKIGTRVIRQVTRAMGSIFR